MQNSTLLKLSLTLSILGIIILFLISTLQTPELISIRDINQNLLYKKIQVNGKITSIRNQTNFQIITINDSTGKINVIYNNKNKKSSLIKNQNIIVFGKISEYKNKYKTDAELQISVDKIIIS